MKENKQFKTESKQLLNLMIHSIYSNKEIFLRELISNASDALDKRHYLSLQDSRYNYNQLEINLKVDEKNRTITISDNGIGMNYDELETNLGTIAHSGTKAFVSSLENNENIADIIGQFGVGFYSSFMVAHQVTVTSKSVDGSCYEWQSNGEEAYTIEEATKDEMGTTIVLELREGEEFDAFLDEYEIEMLVKKYSDYIKYPIKMDVTTTKPKEDSDEVETIIENKTLNSQIALWKKDKKTIDQAEYDSFYQTKFNDYQNPLYTIHTKVEGKTNYDALLFIPQSKSYDFYTTQYQKGLDLYSKGIFIEGKCDYLISEPFRFVRGLVDTADVSLNISREMLQQDQHVERIAKSLETKIKNELLKLQRTDREKYNKLYDEFGMQLMYGIYENFGAKKELLQDLIMFKSSLTKEYMTLNEYVEKMKEDQKDIYYMAGESIEAIEKAPVMEKVLDKGIEVLYFLNEVDEFAIQVLFSYKEKNFKSIVNAQLDLEDEASKEELKAKNEANKDLLAQIQEALTNEVSEVRLTSRLKNSAVCLVSKDEGLSLEMEKILAQMPDAQNIKAQRVLEINPDHPLFTALEKVSINKKDQVKLYASLLYKQALLVEGLKIEDPISFANEMAQLMIEANK